MGPHWRASMRGCHIAARKVEKGADWGRDVSRIHRGCACGGAGRGRPVAPAYGYAVFVQSGASVQKRVGEIMPGDVVWISEARFKGHKGLQGYSQHVGGEAGGGEAVVGVVSEFEGKKSKVRVFQANQHVGQQTVEAVSYRLEDLKSGTVKVFRVLEA
ncbi:hypothetical protein CPB85DRAFT_959686 [Mucidula mucida]|nr:hypothetical protein CPB85DRAFT_959686 [Mucidula mucida]